jgi:hypothetical protein
MFARILRCFAFALVVAAVAVMFGNGPATAAGVDVRVAPRVPVRLEARGAERPIELRALGITSDIIGRFAMTTVEMTFFNPNNRVLEGELQFPLADGQTVTGFALSLADGKREVMREAVPVDKAKGRRTFEAIERQNVDPALLEVTQGNNFKLRVYPLDPGGERRVRVTYSETLLDTRDGVLYRLPLAYADKIGRLDIRLGAEGIEAPSVRGITAGGAGFEVSRAGVGAYNLALSASDVSPGVGEIAIPFTLIGEDSVYLGRRKDKTYFHAEIVAETGAETASAVPYPKTLSILWDASASGRSRDRAREFAFLGAFFAAARDVAVDLQRARDVAEPAVKFEVSGGDWSALKDALAETVYDGATNLGAFDTGAPSDMFFLFSDGLDNYSAAPFAPPQKPLYALMSSTSADATRLKFLAANGGAIDLRTFDPERDAMSELLAPRARIISAEGPGVSDVVWSRGERGVFRLAGVVNGPGAKLTLTFETPSGKRVKRDISLDSAQEESDSGSVPYLWASMKIESLEGEYDLNRGEIRRLGKEFGIPTRETSLMVLETAADYARYDIDPPSDMKPEFDRLRASVIAQRGDQNKLRRVIAEWKSRVDWWEKDFPKGPTPKPKTGAFAPEEGLPGTAANMPGYYADSAGALRDEAREMSPSRQALALDASFSRRSLDFSETKADEPASPSPAREAAVSIALRPWSPDEPYIRRMRETRDEDLYRVYLDERPDYENSVPFFIDVSYQLSERGFEDLSLRVLSNLAEMDLENRQILRVLGYRLLGTGKAEQAVVIFKRVLALADDEPQSYRDLALARDAAGDKQSAVDMLYDAAVRDFERDFPGIEVIALTEMNAIIASSPEPLDTSKIDTRLRGSYPLDLRVVLAWDTDNTDIDLHVIDPNGEEAFYGAPLSYQGGRVSPDNTVGYGPEEYSLKEAKPGVYRVEVNFYGHSQQLISESTTIQLDFFTHYGEKTQKKQSVTMRLKDAKDRIFVGEFEVK